MASDPVTILDPADKRLAPYRQMRDPAGRARVEAGEGIFVAEGRLAVEQLIDSEYPVRSVLVTGERMAALAALLGRVHAAPVFVASRAVVATTVGFDLHRGIVAIGGRVAPAGMSAVLAGTGAVLVLEGVNDHENIGALFRNARALGAGAVLLDPTCADPLYRRSVRVSLGHVLAVPFARVEPWPGGLAGLTAAGFTLAALVPGPGAVPIQEVAAGPKRRWALMVGAEGAGLSDAARSRADVEIGVPMAAGVDSLNVATAAAIALHRLVDPAPA